MAHNIALAPPSFLELDDSYHILGICPCGQCLAEADVMAAPRMSEVITIQCGHYSNFIGTHLWNLQVIFVKPFL